MALSFQSNNDGEFVSLIGVNFSLDIPADCQDKSLYASLFDTSFYTMSFLSIGLLKELLYPFHLTYNLSPFFLITFSILNSF